MAKVQAYVSDEIVYKINKIVERRRAEGAKSTDVSFSSISTMLLELGLRVHEAQMERKESAFNQAEFNKVLLECAVKTQSTVAKILDLVENATSKKAETENFITRFAKYYQSDFSLLIIYPFKLVFNWLKKSSIFSGVSLYHLKSSPFFL